VHSNLECASVTWNNLTLTNSNKLENILRKFVNLCYNRFIQSNYLRNYELILNYLHLKTLYSRPQHLDPLFLVNVFMNKINCYSIILLWTLSAYIYPQSKSGTFPLLESKMSRD
jgi:hypothetical protein